MLSQVITGTVAQTLRGAQGDETILELHGCAERIRERNYHGVQLGRATIVAALVENFHASAEANCRNLAQSGMDSCRRAADAGQPAGYECNRESGET
ncbi:hypothetical protein RJ55_04451 [Drechmeria coniospora]|nr:hypothetical protein RJ55_04451 [Drechmeria coniospora]